MECTLRAWKKTDADDLSKALNNPAILKNLRDGLPYPYTKQDALQYIDSMLSAKENSAYAFAVCIDDKAIGSIGVFRQNNIHKYTGELGYYIAQEYWSKGVGTSAVRQICDYIFKYTDIMRIFAEPFFYNTASCRILEKNGFSYEGTLRSNAVKDKVVLDMKMYSLLVSDVNKSPV